MKKKRMLAGLAALFLAVSMAGTAYAGSWEAADGGWKYKTDGGRYVKGRWVEEGGSWYYIEKDGYMRTGWMQDGGKWYYLGEDGAMLKGVTRNIGGVDYAFDENGAMTGGEEAAQPETEAAVVESGVKDGWNGVTYTSRKLDFELTVPEGFIDVNYSGSSLDTGDAEINLSVAAPDSTVAVAVASFFIPAESSEQVTAKTMAGEMKRDFEQTGLYDNIGEVSESFLGGYQYFKLPMSYRGILRQDLYFRRTGDILMLMQIIYEPGHREMVNGILGSMKKVD